MAAPLFHEAPALFSLTQLFAGGTVVVTPDSNPANVFDLIARERVTWTFMVPTMWAAIVASPAFASADLSSLRAVISGGSPLQTYIKKALIERLPDAGLHEFYGATEVGLITNLHPEDQLRKTRCVGRPVPGMFVELRDDAGAVVKTGEIGEIHIGGSTLIREYYRNPEATAKARSDGDSSRWATWGFDEEGYLYIVDRRTAWKTSSPTTSRMSSISILPCRWSRSWGHRMRAGARSSWPWWCCVPTRARARPTCLRTAGLTCRRSRCPADGLSAGASAVVVRQDSASRGSTDLPDRARSAGLAACRNPSILGDLYE